MPHSAISKPTLAAAAQKRIPLETGRSAPMVEGKIVIAAPAVTAAGAIVLSLEGATASVAPAITERKAGVSFTVETVSTSTDRVNWAVYGE